jgi:hypothetical protein
MSVIIDHDFWAKQVLLFLVNRMKNNNGEAKFISYGELAKEINYPQPYIGSLFALNIGRTLGVLGHLIDKVIVDGETPPFIQALVVQKQSNLPGDGIKEFYPDYPRLSPNKKRDYINKEYNRIFLFGNRWEILLEKLGITPTDDIFPPTQHRYNPYGSEGSPEHKRLRDYIVNNPEILYTHPDEKGIIEYPLKSGDSVDVYFETESESICVEVKSSRSGPDDIERGLFQCIKYRTIVEAENKVLGIIKPVKSILVLEEEIPNNLRKVRDCLGIICFENIKPDNLLSN